MNKAGILIICMTLISQVSVNSMKTKPYDMQAMKSDEQYDIATLGSGCFWCTEAVYERLKGVQKVISGYSGGKVINPSYKEISSGRTGHAEVCQIYFNPEQISYEELLDVFWHTHDPTTLNRQGNDVGPQYRSIILYHSENQKEAAFKSRARIDSEGTFSDPVVTEIVPYVDFYKAEDYHQDYFLNNPRQPYCTHIVKPKVEKFKAKYQDKLK